jgi:predicted Rossmann fold nucleotide-binding protein DprA/Smf involved in DNA uptake
MKVIIAGSRDFHDYDTLLNGIKESKFIISEVVSGMASGVDQLAIRYAKENNLPLHEYWAEWEFYGKSAGPIRNELMAKNADQLIAIWDGKSKGTKNMIETMNRMNKPVYIVRIDR